MKPILYLAALGVAVYFIGGILARRALATGKGLPIGYGGEVP